MKFLITTPQAARTVIFAVGLLTLIWLFRYFDPFVTPSKFADLPQPLQGAVPEYPKIEDLTAGAEEHDHSEANKSWVFGIVEDDTVIDDDSEEWLRHSTGRLTSMGVTDTMTKTLKDTASTLGISSASAQSHTASDARFSEDHVTPVQMTLPQTIAPTTLAEGQPPAAKTDTNADRGIISGVIEAATSASAKPTSTPLILYAYFPAPWALPNLNFFLRHGLHGSATFIFIINGALVPGSEDEQPNNFRNSTDEGVVDVLGVVEPYAEKHPNVRVWKRPNTCYDLGAYAEVLKADSSMLITTHERFILINASLRGPFVPFWSGECWSDAYLRLIDTRSADLNSVDTEQVKLVGMTINCGDNRPRHIQSMILATDRTGINLLLGKGDHGSAMGNSSPSNTSSTNYTGVGLDFCPSSMAEAVDMEVSLTALIKSHNYTVRAMMAQFWSQRGYEQNCTNGNIHKTEGAYGGGNLGVYETLFIKTRWAIQAEHTEKITQWYDGALNSRMSTGAWGKCGLIHT